MEKIVQRLQQQLEERRRSNALRSLSISGAAHDFCSNDYLSLARCPAFRRRLLDRQMEEARHIGSGGSRLLSGNSVLAEQLESRLASFLKTESALLFTSGYTANLGLLSCVAGRSDTMLYDQLVHASIRDGLRLSLANGFSFRHNDLEHLRERLSRAQGAVFIVVESVYSMDGDEAPLRELAALAREYGAALIVDEAHATGVFGARGEGLVVEQGLESQVWARVHTFGKAMGSHGAVVAGSSDLRDYLINFARSFIYTTAMPDHSLPAVDLALDELEQGSRQALLRERIARFTAGLSAAAHRQFIPSRSAIQSLIWPGNEAVKQLAGELIGAGFDIRPILHPTVPRGQERLRICLHLHNEDELIDELVHWINQRVERYE